LFPDLNKSLLSSSTPFVARAKSAATQEMMSPMLLAMSSKLSQQRAFVLMGLDADTVKKSVQSRLLTAGALWCIIIIDFVVHRKKKKQTHQPRHNHHHANTTRVCRECAVDAAGA
jgi:hypothetical protein